MLGLTGILIALIVLTIVLAGVFLVRPSITAGATGKILAFVGLCVLPALCIGTGMSFHMQRSQQTAYCISCHSMETHGQSLYVLDTKLHPCATFSEPPRAAGRGLLYLPHGLHHVRPFEGQAQRPEVPLYGVREYATQNDPSGRHVQQPAVPALPCGHAQL